MDDAPQLNCPLSIIGKLQRDYILPIDGDPLLDSPGGNLLYTAAGTAMWGGTAGLVARVSADYPLNWLDFLSGYGFDLRGIRKNEEVFDMRRFIAYTEPQFAHYDNPLNHFAKRGLPLPSELLGYEKTTGKISTKNTYDKQSIHIQDIPWEYKEVKAVHICPIDFISHKTLPPILKTGAVQTISMSSSPCYMDPLFFDEIGSILSDLTIFMAEEGDLKRLFQGRCFNMVDITKRIGGMGPEYIVIHLKDGTHQVLDSISGKQWAIPAYQVRKVLDPTGALDAFAGAFLYIYQQSFNPIEAALAGSVSASFVKEGINPHFLLDIMPGLKEARLESLRSRVIAF